MSAEDFLSRMKNVKQTGPGRWICSCPAHEDKHPSCNVTEAPDGTLLVICRAGCQQEAIREASGLHWSAFFPRADMSYAEAKRGMRAAFPARDVLEALANEALLVAVAAGNIANGVELTAADRERLMVAAERIMTARTMTNG